MSTSQHFLDNAITALDDSYFCDQAKVKRQEAAIHAQLAIVVAVQELTEVLRGQHPGPVVERRDDHDDLE